MNQKKNYYISAFILYLNYFIHGIGCSVLGQVAVIRLAHQNRLRQSQCHDAVVGRKASISKEIKLLSLDVVPFEAGTYDVPNDRS